MRGPRILIMEDDRGLGVYLRDAGCEFWRVHDCATGPPHAPPGKPQLVGADASHAWFSVFCPDVGWLLSRRVTVPERWQN